MIDKLGEADALLSRAHDLCWALGKYDCCTGIIAVLNRLRGFVPPRPFSDARDDLDDEADAHGVTLRELTHK